MIERLTRLISAQPGDLVYHLIVLFAIEAILLLAIGQGRRSQWTGQTLRVTLASVGLLALRIAQVAVALVSEASWADPTWIMPPLERFASVASLGLLAWALLPWVEDYPQTGLGLVIANSAGCIIAYALLGPAWHREVQITEQFYNATPASWGWSVWAATLAALSGLAALLRRRDQWGSLAAIFGLFLLGHLLNLLEADTTSHVAGWVRLAELCSYPALAGLMLRRAIDHSGAAAKLLPDSLAVSAPWTAIEACQRVAETGNLIVAVQRAGMSMNNLLGTDALAIGLLNKDGDAIDLAAICRAGLAPRSGPTFDVASQPPIQLALNRKRAVVVNGDQAAQHATLAALIGGASGSLWVQPLTHQRVAIGILIAGRFAQRGVWAWTSGELEALNGLCGVLAAALSAAQTSSNIAQQVAQLQQQLREREAALAQSELKTQQLGAQLAQAQAQRKRAPLAVPARPDPVREATPPVERQPVGEPGLPPASEKTLRVQIKLDGGSPLKSARAMMVLAHVKRVGRVVACLPVEADLRSGGFEDEFTVTFSTASEPSAIRAALAAIRDVLSVDAQVI